MENDISQLLSRTHLLEQHAILKYQNVSVTTHGTANTEFSVAHGLGVVPLGYIVISRDKAAVIYDSTTAWDREKIYLKANTATVVIRLLIF